MLAFHGGGNFRQHLSNKVYLSVMCSAVNSTEAGLKQAQKHKSFSFLFFDTFSYRVHQSLHLFYLFAGDSPVHVTI